ncbi:hypothetical protein D3C73_1532020 [compost metagenome]
MEQQIRSDFETAKTRQLDIYKIDDILYRKHNRLWKKYNSSKQHSISRTNLGDVNVDLKVTHSTSYKLKNK